MASKCLLLSKERRKQKKRLLLGASLWMLQQITEHKVTRSCWVKPWITRRLDYGAFHTLVSELAADDQGSYLNFLRVTPNLFDDLLVKVTPYIERQDTNYRKSISAGTRLAITLRFLATGETYKSLGYLFRVGNNTIGRIVPETCRALHSVLAPDYLQCPQSPDEWLAVAHEFQQVWNFPNCLGALDGKHVVIRRPACSGSKFFNYKHSFSIILLALVDAHYKFLFVDIGSQGRCSDAGVFSESTLNTAMQDNTVGIPAPAPLPGRTQPFPFVVVGDDAFPLRQNILKPFPHRDLTVQQRVYNYRLSRARRCVENAFGIMACRFRVLLNPMCLEPGKVDSVISACCCLHNMLRTLSPNNYVADPSRPRTAEIKQFLPQAKVGGRRSVTKDAKLNRQYLCEYFNSDDGSVSWQHSMI